MIKPIHGACLAALSFSFTGALAAATPAQTEQRAARGVNTAVATHGQLLETDDQFVYGSRQIVDVALNQLEAATTFAALLVPGGVTVNCPVSGTLNARISGWPRTLKLEWAHCVSIEYGSRNDLNGPAEVALGENSLAPALVLSIRLGDRNRDYVVDETPEPSRPSFGGQTISRNVRVTGILPMTREYEPGGRFLGRYVVEARGFTRRVQRLPDYNASTGEYSAEFYDFSTTYSTDGALLTGTYTVNGLDNLLEVALPAGKVSGRFIYPVRPTKPTKTLDMWFKGTGLTTRFAYTNDPSHYSVWVDGKVEGDFNQFYPLGCTGADTYTFRTRAPMTLSPYSYSYEFFDSGELVVDGKSVATFSATGTQAYVDLVGHVLLEVPGVGTFNYDYDDYLFAGPLADAGRCTP